jgi:hypothetical protein
MRGEDEQTGALFSYLSPEALVPAEHPLRAIRPVVDAALERLSAEFAKLYSPYGRASIAPEKLLRALLLQAFYGVRSERQLMEQVGYNMLFRWFIGLSMDAPVWDVTVFTKNRDRLGRTRRGGSDDRNRRAGRRCHPGRRQGLRYRRARGQPPPDRGHTACGAEHHHPPLRH